MVSNLRDSTLLQLLLPEGLTEYFELEKVDKTTPDFDNASP